MSNIRRQSIISSFVIYIGFAIGLLNTYLFARKGVFLDEEFGLYNIFIQIATTMMAFSNLAMPSFLHKFYPYYKEHLPAKKNDQVTWALVVSLAGFLIVVIAGICFKDLVIRKYSAHAPLVVTFYNWIFVLGFGQLVYTVLEAYAWQLHKSVFTNYLKEVQWRLFTTVLIVLFSWGVINNFGLFIKLFAFSYPFIAATLLIYLLVTKQIHFNFSVSKVTRRHMKSILRLSSFIYASSLIFNISQVFDSLVIGSVMEDGLVMVAVYSVAQNVTALIQAPQRGIVAASIAHLSRAWKEKDMPKLQRIYERSSINQLIFSMGFYFLITINFIDAVNTFHLKETYLAGFYVFLFLGATKIVDMGTGLNSQIIGTSTYWKFELQSGVVLLITMLPLTYLLTKTYGLIGPAIANLVSVTIYNLVRLIFLWKKFRLQPFTMRTIYAILLSTLCFVICWLVFRNMHGFVGLFARSIAFVIIYGAATYYLELSPDVKPVIKTILKKLKLRRA